MNAERVCHIHACEDECVVILPPITDPDRLADLMVALLPFTDDDVDFTWDSTPLGDRLADILPRARRA